MDQDTAGSIKRAVAGFAAFSAPFIAGWLNSRGIAIDSATVIAAEVALLGYLGQSVANSIHRRSVAAATPAASTVAGAVADLAAGPKP